jgi:hypothetical protein
MILVIVFSMPCSQDGILKQAVIAACSVNLF